MAHTGAHSLSIRMRQVKELKKAIKLKKQKSIMCVARKLELYLAQKDGAILVDQSADLAELSKVDCSQEVRDR